MPVSAKKTTARMGAVAFKTRRPDYLQKMSHGWKRSGRAIPPMILSHPNDHDSRPFSSSSALAASAGAPAWERLVGPESRPESREGTGSAEELSGRYG